MKIKRRRWKETEVANIIIDNLDDFALRFDLQFLANWFRVTHNGLWKELEKKGIKYGQVRKQQLADYIAAHLHLNDSQIAYKLDITPFTAARYRKLQTTKLGGENNDCRFKEVS